jgi:hypothetical protein
MWFAIIDSSNNVVSYCTNDSQGFENIREEKVSIDNPPNENEMWDASIKSIVARPVVPDSSDETERKRLISKSSSSWNDRDNASANRLHLLTMRF